MTSEINNSAMKTYGEIGKRTIEKRKDGRRNKRRYKLKAIINKEKI